MTDRLWDLNVLLCAACDHGEEGGNAFDFNPSRYPAFGRLVAALSDDAATQEVLHTNELRDKIRELAQRVIAKYDGTASPVALVLADFGATLREIIRLTKTTP